MKIFVDGWYGHSNVGDESYKESFRQIMPGHDLVFVDSFRRTETGFDAAIIGGGDVVRPARVKKFIQRFHDIPKIVMSVTITQESLCPELSMFDRIVVRDNMSLGVLRNYGIAEHVPCSMVPDSSIILKGRRELGLTLLKRMFTERNLEMREKLWVFTANAHLLFNDDRTLSTKQNTRFEVMKNAMVELAESADASAVFLPYSVENPWDDRVSNGIVGAYCKWHRRNLTIFDDRLTLQNTLDIISAADLNVTTRFHGLIFGVGNGVPTVPITFHDKTRGFCETIGVEPLDYYEITDKTMICAAHAAKATPYDTSKIIDAYRKEIQLLRK